MGGKGPAPDGRKYTGTGAIKEAVRFSFQALGQRFFTAEPQGETSLVKVGRPKRVMSCHV